MRHQADRGCTGGKAFRELDGGGDDVAPVRISFAKEEVGAEGLARHVPTVEKLKAQDRNKK